MKNNEFEEQKRAYSNYLKLFYPNLQWTSTIYKTLFDILNSDLELTKANLGDYFFEQYINDINKNLNRIEKEVLTYVQNNNFDKTQKEHLLYHKPLLEKSIYTFTQKFKSITPPSINQHSQIFSNNGFELFNYILNNHIKPKGERGRYSDLSFYYWKMYNSQEKYIHQRPEAFKNWFCNKYNDNFEKIKTLAEVTDNNGNRLKHYQTSLDWFKKNFIVVL